MSGGAPTRVTIVRLGRRGEGVADTERGPIHVPYALPGETVGVDIEGNRGTLVALIEPSADRIEPVCPHFGVCGGCSVQAWAAPRYAEWKRDLLVSALAREGISNKVGPLVDAHGLGRRRAVFHARTPETGKLRVGYMQARAHTVVSIEACPILDPALEGALPAAWTLAEVLAATGKPLDIAVTATDTGLDIDMRGLGPITPDLRERLVAVASAHRLARLSNHGIVIVEPRRPSLRIGKAAVEPPPGVFLQATRAGEEAIAGRVIAALSGTRRVADLFCGIGTFALRAAEFAEVTGFDSEALALGALDKASRRSAGVRPVVVERRDLFRRPLSTEDIGFFDAVVLDPPRAGAEAQMRAIAASRIERVVSVACDARTFARDAAILSGAGFVPEAIDPIDQFRYSAHVEIVATFRRPQMKMKRRLLG